MLSKLQNSLFIRVFSGLMFLYMVNLSVDSPDPKQKHIPENLDYNDQESLIEILLEKILGFDNLLPEFDDDDGAKSSINLKVNLDHLLIINDNALNSAQEVSLSQFFKCFRIYRTARGYSKEDHDPPEIEV